MFKFLRRKNICRIKHFGGEYDAENMKEILEFSNFRKNEPILTPYVTQCKNCGIRGLFISPYYYYIPQDLSDAIDAFILYKISKQELTAVLEKRTKWYEWK